MAENNMDEKKLPEGVNTATDEVYDENQIQVAALAAYSADEGGGGELGEVDLTVPVCSVPVQDEGFRYLLVGGFDHILFLSLREVFSGDPGGSCSVGVENADDVACADVFLVSDVEIHGFFSFRVGGGLYMGFWGLVLLVAC